MAERKRNPLLTWFMAAIVVLMAALFFNINFSKLYNLFLMLAGLGAVVFVHELGHFIAAKAVGIKVEGFALGFNPILLGVQRVAGGFQLRILPELFQNNEGVPRLQFVLPWASARPGETEYRLGIIPLGGYVKMLGQEDTGPDKQSDDPRAFPNKKIWQRALVVSAGVIMNIITGFIIFWWVFSVGIKLQPAVVGDVIKDYPAAKAGLQTGDRIVRINDKTDLNFMDLMLAGAFAGDEKVRFDVIHPDGSPETIHIQPIKPAQGDLGIRVFGIGRPITLTIDPKLADSDDSDEFQTLADLKKAGLAPGDTIIAANGRPMKYYGEIVDIINPPIDTPAPDSVKLTVSPQGDATQQRELSFPVILAPAQENPGILGMVPRLKVGEVQPDTPAQQAGLMEGDIILRVGIMANPTLPELRQQLKNNINRPVEVLVYRPAANGSGAEKTLTVTHTRPAGAWWRQFFMDAEQLAPRMGFIPLWDVEHPIVAETKSFKLPNAEKPTPALALPRGAVITAIGEQPVQNWKDILVALQKHAGAQAKISYRLPGDESAQICLAPVPDAKAKGWIDYQYVADTRVALASVLQPLEEIYQGKNWLSSIRMGLDHSWTQISQTYLMLRSMLTGEVGLKAASGPVGILKMSYTVAATKELTYYFFFLAMINMAIAVFNFLPFPVVDGGHIVFLLIEKIKGSPVSVKAQSIATTIGLVMILGFVLLVTYHDIARLVTGQL